MLPFVRLSNMSDSDSDPEFVDFDIRHGAKFIYENDSPFVALQPPDAIYERWNKIPVSLKKKAAQLMHVCGFWYHILLCRGNHNTTRWAVQVGFIDSNVSNDLSLKRLHRIEILEAILRAMDKGCLLDEQTRHMVWISNKFNLHVPEALDDAMRWLEWTGEHRIKQRVQELGPSRNCFAALQFIFTEYAHYTQAMGANRKKLMSELAKGPDQCSNERSEEMKSKGNDHFQKKKYDSAVKCYSKAIKYNPYNHIIYGNRALCYIRCEKYLKAVGDGKRAALLQPEWAKGHYRYCEALFLLGERTRAMEANEWALTLCKSDPEGMKDLLQQHEKFLSEMEARRLSAEDRRVGTSSKTAAKIVTSKRTESTTRGNTMETSQQTAKPVSRVEPSSKSNVLENKCLDVKLECQTQPGKDEGSADSVDYTQRPQDTKREMADKKRSKPEPNVSEKIKGKGRNQHSKEKMVILSSGVPSLRDVLVSAVQEAHMALSDQRYHNAENAFSSALSILDTSTPKELGLCALDQVVLIYGHATALIQIGQPEKLAGALKDFEKIKTFEERTFHCLVFYGIGKVYQKENRFSVALEQFLNSMQVVKKNITPGKLTWPTTKVIVEETKPDYFKELLEDSIDMCRFPPNPDAICRHHSCHGHSKIEIYFTDPDFKGFIRMVCCQSCKVEYHISCWKKLKATVFPDKNEKDFLQGMCFTPDCGSRICHIVIYGSTGLVKCEFEASIEKPTGTTKLRVKQKCTSLKTLKAKEDRKLRRKQRRQEASINTQDKNDQRVLENQEAVAVGQENASSTTNWQSYEDRVLLQIHNSKELFRHESHNVSVLMKNLKPWMDLDQFKGNKLCMYARQPETLGAVVDILLERKNRVWARIFIQSLSSCLDTSPKLHDWAQELERAGLNAAGLFIDRYAAHLEQLDLAPLLSFPPVQDMLIEKFGTMPMFFSSHGLTVTEYLKQAPPHEKRLFIWTLEEHRDQYTSCHTVLDEYFEIMDGFCLVIKKTDIENKLNSPIKAKNRNRKKKQKDAKGSVIVLSGMRGGASRDEDDDNFFDGDDSLLFGDLTDPFSVPHHLRHQVAEFEGQYNTGSHSSHYKRILDNNPDPTKESLYDYFAQILEKYGPLETQDPLLVGEFENFPPDTQMMIQEAGGLKLFLLESLRFVMIEDHVGLMKHAVSLQEANSQIMDGLESVGDVSNSLSLNPSAYEFLPKFQDSGPWGYNEESMATIPVQPNQVQVCPGLPSPYVYPVFTLNANGVAGADDNFHNNYDPVNLEDLDLYIGDVDEQGPWETVSAPVTHGTVAAVPGKIAAEVQVSAFDSLSEVAVNTEPYEIFEGKNGDMTKKEKSNAEFEQQIEQMKQDYDTVIQRRQQEISDLEGELEHVNHSIQITLKELGLFRQKLEEEVKKDQQEKKENQDILKTLKAEIKELAESQESISKSIHEKNKEYETCLNNFLELSNQSATEKMSLEDEIKRCRDSCAKATRRSQGAELSVLENRRERSLRCLYKFLSDTKAILAQLKEGATRFPFPLLQSATDAWEACFHQAEERVRATEAQYQEQMEQVKRGTRLCTLPLVAVPSIPQAPTIPMLFPPHTHQQLPYPPMHMRGPVYVHQNAPRAASVPARTPSVVSQPSTVVDPYRPSGGVPRPSQPQQNHASRPLASQPNSVYEKIVGRLRVMFPHYSRDVLCKFIGEMRTENGGTLSSLSYEEVINRVAQLILDHQDTTREQLTSVDRGDPGSPLCVTPSRSNSPASVRSTGTPPPAHVWKTGVANKRSQSKALNLEDPCIICHDEMSREDLCVLECRHSFHRECIKSWLKEQSTCPTCREHVLLPEDFPLLPGRIRKSFMPATFS
ncbi:E3 ubiquitin-protein ligase TTC3 isoform X2 [Esox lucius]|uniref:E3 ubiquitin-protein ligase TTC3 isoform X2 n=1 Tax=Esox lucius TaxID=8010 RepID=UPI0005770F01|nr:E3 ubiquitin-protein ligase TTC3 isoform X2 [Esox lucius]